MVDADGVMVGEVSARLDVTVRTLHHWDDIGLARPSLRTTGGYSVSYLGVRPEHRGQGLVDDLLAGNTLVHADNGAPRITGTTDTTNSPMAAAFGRAGYDITSTRIVIKPHPGETLGNQ